MSALPEAVVTLTTQPTYPTLPQVVCPFEPAEWLFLNTSLAAPCHVSFDGVHDHAFLDPATARGISWQSSYQKVWLRRTTAGIDVATVRVMAGTDV